MTDRGGSAVQVPWKNLGRVLTGGTLLEGLFCRMMVGNGHNADGGRLNKNFHGLDVCNVINTAAA